jgi:acetate kinase
MPSQLKNILVFNCGSSSLSYKVFACNDSEGIRVVLFGKANRGGVKGMEPSFIETCFHGATQKDIIALVNH